MPRVSISQFHSSLGWDKHRKVWHEVCDCNIRSYIFMKQHSIDCTQLWSSINHQSSLKHMEVKIEKIVIVFWVKGFQDMDHLIIVNWFDRSGFWIYNIFRVRFNWKLWRVNLNITIINGMMIKFLCGIWNNRTGFGRIGRGFEVSWFRLAVPLYWWLIWFFTMKFVELIHPSSLQSSVLCPRLPQHL